MVQVLHRTGLAGKYAYAYAPANRICAWNMKLIFILGSTLVAAPPCSAISIVYKESILRESQLTLQAQSLQFTTQLILIQWHLSWLSAGSSSQRNTPTSTPRKRTARSVLTRIAIPKSLYPNPQSATSSSRNTGTRERRDGSLIALRHRRRLMQSFLRYATKN